MSWILFGALVLLGFVWKPAAPLTLIVPLAAMLTGLADMAWRKLKP